MRRWALVFILLACAWWTSWSQEFDPDHLMLLVVGPSASRPTADQTALIQRVQKLRSDPSLAGLKVATMHFDRPREAQFAQKVLGIHRAMLPAVALVQLDEQGRNPIRSLQVWSGLTRQRQNQIESIAEEWSRMAGNPLPLFTPVGASVETPTRRPPAQFEPAPSLPAQSAAAPTPPAPVLLPPPPPPRDRVWAGVGLAPGAFLRSGDGRFELVFEIDGNLAIYRILPSTRQLWWSTQTRGSGASVLRLGTDGVVRLLNSSGQVVWSGGKPDTFSNGYLHMQNDGNLVAYRNDGNGSGFSWSSESMENPPPPR